jgi:hypothetical protein
MSKKGCPKCAWRPEGTKVEVNKSQSCEKCKKRRGAKIVLQKSSEHRAEKFRMICFDCHHAESGKRFYRAETSGTYNTKAESDFAKALEVYYLRPLFYGDKVNYTALELAGFEKNRAVYLNNA